MIKDLLQNKTLQQKADIKSQTIVDLNISGKYKRNEVEIDILSTTKIDGGVVVLARVYKNGKQLGFGADGSVDIERFKIFNPPILVPDGTTRLETVSVGVLKETKTVSVVNFKEDPEEALKLSLVHTIGIVGKENTKIEEGKIGKTTSTFYPDANNPGSTSVDGTIRSGGTNNYATHHGATTGSGLDPQNSSTLVVTNSVSGGNYYIDRSPINFDTSPLGASATISAGVCSVMNNKTYDFNNGDSTSISLVTNSITSNVAYATTDFSYFGTTKQATDITLASLTNGVYADYTLDATGLSNISKIGITKFALRLLGDVNNSAPAGNNSCQFYGAETAGTTSDPKLVVTYTAPGLANVKTINDLAIASVKSVNGLAIASVKTFNGLA